MNAKDRIMFVVKALLSISLALQASVCILRAEGSKPAFADGKTDATEFIQKMLDDRGVTGGEVELPAGLYLIDGSIEVPTGVSLCGSWKAPHHGSAWQKGTTFLITAGRGHEDSPAAIRMQANASVEGLTLLWPRQMAAHIAPYPWAILGMGAHDTIENITLVNAYQGIKTGDQDGSLHLIRNVFGCVLRRGVMVDNTTDIGRIENVHFNPHYWGASGHPSRGGDEDFKQAVSFLQSNLDGFIFGRSDWEYVTNTFIWGAKNGYLFVKTKAGDCNGQFLGIGADFCQACVRIDNIQTVGIQVTNGEFTAFAGDPNSAIVTSPGADGAAQFVNCNFWGIRNHVAWMQGSTAVTLSDCHICDNLPAGAVLAEKGRLILRGCTFDQNCPAAILEPGVTTAIVAENLEPGGVRIENHIGSRAVVGLNQEK